MRAIAWQGAGHRPTRHGRGRSRHGLCMRHRGPARGRAGPTAANFRGAHRSKVRGALQLRLGRLHRGAG
eukprot:14367752-Alexandrium_andersonii.AAC.1